MILALKQLYSMLNEEIFEKSNDIVTDRLLYGCFLVRLIALCNIDSKDFSVFYLLSKSHSDDRFHAERIDQATFPNDIYALRHFYQEI